MKLDFEGVKKLEKHMVEVSRILKDLEKNGGDPLSSKAAKAYNALGEVSYIFRKMLRDIDNDRLNKEFETGTYESKVSEELDLVHVYDKNGKKIIGTGQIVHSEKPNPSHVIVQFDRELIKSFPRDRVKPVNEQKTNNHSNPVTEAAKKKLVSRINSIALKEGISKKEATIKAIKSLQESK